MRCEALVWYEALACSGLAAISLCLVPEFLEEGAPWWTAITIFNYSMLAGRAVYLALGFDKPKAMSSAVTADPSKKSGSGAGGNRAL